MKFEHPLAVRDRSTSDTRHDDEVKVREEGKRSGKAGSPDGKADSRSWLRKFYGNFPPPYI